MTAARRFGLVRRLVWFSAMVIAIMTAFIVMSQDTAGCETERNRCAQPGADHK
jgi:hypothetical protein